MRKEEKKHMNATAIVVSICTMVIVTTFAILMCQLTDAVKELTNALKETKSNANDKVKFLGPSGTPQFGKSPAPKNKAHGKKYHKEWGIH